MSSRCRALLRLGACLLALVPASSAQEPAAAPEPPRASAAPAAPRVVVRGDQRIVLLQREHRGACVDVRTDGELDPEEYAALADRVLPRLRAWFEVPRAPGSSPAPRYTIFLCRSVETMFEVERLIGEPSSSRPGRSFAFRGGFYARNATILLQIADVRSLSWTVVHELSHAAFFERVGRGADFFDEGLAELLPDWLLFSECARPEEHVATYGLYESRCARAVREGAEPGLSWLLSRDYWSFRDDRIDGLGFASSWALMKLLVESREIGVAGRVQALLADLAQGVPQKDALARECELQRVQRRWHELMRGWVKWEAVWGAWDNAGNDWTTVLTEWGSTLLLGREAPRAGPLDVGFSWTAPAAEWVGIGFVVGMRDSENLALVDLSEPDHRVHVNVCSAGEWERKQSWPLPVDLELECQPLALHCEPDGSAWLTIGSFAVVLEGLDASVADGRAGLALTRRPDSPRRTPARVTFGDAWMRH